MHSPQELVSQVNTLTSLPSVYVRIREIIEAQDSSMASIAGVIAADPALCARILQLVNSPAYANSGRVDSIGRAISMLGLDRVHDLVLAMSLCTIFDELQPHHLDMERFWRGCVMRGLAARSIGRLLHRPDTERLFVTGLLSDLGHLAMYHTVPNLAEAALRTASKNNEPLQQVEHRIIGCDHAEVGAALLAHWRLPPCITDAIGAQHHPQMGGEFNREAAIVQLAAHLADAEQDALDNNTAAARMPASSWQLLELDPPSVDDLRHTLRTDLDHYLHTLFPHAAHT